MFKTTLILLLCLARYTHIEAKPTGKHDERNENWKFGDGQCGTNQNHRTKRHDQAIFPRRPRSGSIHGNALEFEHGQVIRYHKLKNPAKKFTVDFWMKPEGGQRNPTIILGVFDTCAAKTLGWFIGLREASVQSDLRVTFTMHTASASKNTSIMSHRRIEARRWIHVAASYDGRRMKLYVNQAKVAVGHGQKGIIFDSATQEQGCDSLEIGGDHRKGYYYRGQIDKLRLWSDALTHDELTSSLPEDNNNVNAKLLFEEHFNEDDSRSTYWISMTKTRPRFVRSTVPEDKHDLSIRKPPCGVTICDNPEVVRSYLRYDDLRAHKTLKIRVVNVMDDDGKRPTVTTEQINMQHQFIQKVFATYNISWELQVYPVKDSWLRAKIVLHSCEVEQIGDGTCNDNCSYDITGYDGGDCAARGVCTPEKRGNGHCDSECNVMSYNWDEGDCCQDGRASKNCFDPKSQNRVYVSVREYKRRIGLDNREVLNVYVASWRDKNLEGVATFPWEKYVHTDTGGMFLPPTCFHMANHSKTFVHELGHVLGLWHVHHGTTEMENCADECFETFPSMELGDLCSDTKPTEQNYQCRDPTPGSSVKCGAPVFKDTPYANFMGYGDWCADHFTGQQTARMHCYIDLDYQSWQTNAVPSAIPLPPRITSKKGNVINLSWIPPLGSGGKNAKNLCNECEENKGLEQYATTAYSPTPSIPNGNNAPHQSTGFPDAKQCFTRPLSWRPEEPITPCKGCPIYLEVGFKEAVVPTALTIWVTWQSNDAFSDIQLIHTDGTMTSLGGGTAQCDSPYTRSIWKVKKTVSKVRIYVSRYGVSIDAVKLTSNVGHPNCSMCEPLHYVISRNPPFDSGPESQPLSDARYEDTNIDSRGVYEYRVRAVTDDGLSSPFSPPLIYKPEKGFCGDGKIDEGEECDDGNVRDGDGCNIQCQMEDVFRCDGRPSLCYRHDGDGVCEDFEKKKSIRDCGFYTPDGFKDQWTDAAMVNPQYIYNCSEKVIIGPPRHDLKCQYFENGFEKRPCDDEAWGPILTHEMDTVDHWIILSFRRPAIASAIIVYLGFLSNYDDYKPLSMTFQLMDVDKQVKQTLNHTLTSFCKENPLTIPVHHDMSQAFYKTKYIKIIFPSEDIGFLGIAAVSLRSPTNFDPVELSNCRGNELFHPRIQQCHQYKCHMPECLKLIVKNSHKVKYMNGKREGNVAIIECDEGHTPRKPFQAVCNRGKWTVDGDQPLCTPVDCGLPVIQNAKIDCSDGTTYGKKCIYKCNESTKQIGSHATVICEEDGIWSAANLFCQMICRTPRNPAHAHALSKGCYLKKSSSPGDTCKYQCNKGYSSSGNRAEDRFKKTCMKDGSWTGPQCLPVRCPIDEPKIFKWYNCTMKNLYGSVCKLTCPNAKENREVRCKENARWDKTFQLCETKGQCTAPAKLLSGLTVFNCSSPDFTAGTECQMKCPDGFHPARKNLQAAQHTVIPTTACSPMLQWYPDPAKVKCLAKCKFIGLRDGFCDGVNNNEDCFWDGGDCCDSSSLDGDAYRRALFCFGTECACKDPNARDGSGVLPNS